MKTCSLGTLGLILLLALSGCGSPSSFKANQKTVSFQEDAAEFTLSVHPVAIPWDEALVGQLQPNFQMSGKEALGQALPSTLKLEEALVDLMRAKLRASLPTTTVTQSETSRNDDAVSSFTSVRTEEKKPGDISNAPQPDSLGTVQRPENAFGEASRNGSIAMDPILKHQAAMALNQEVQILNAYLKHVEPQGYKAFIVRLQVGLSPYARNAPYDAYATFGFFERGSSGAATSPPIVAPLLVSDNLEGASHARSAEQIRQFALGLAAMLQGVGLQGDFEKLSKRLESVFGSDLNSLLSVGKTTPNVLRVRFGAMNQPDARFAMVPRNNYVTVLILIKESDIPAYRASGLQVGMRTQLRHAQTGKMLKSRTLSLNQLNEINGAFNTEFNLAQLGRLLEKAEQNDLSNFRVMLSANYPNLPAEPLWIYLSDMRLTSANRVAWFDMPPDKTPVIAAAGTTALFSLGEKSSEILLRGNKNSDALRGVAGSLVYSKGNPAVNYRIPARQLVAAEDGTGIRALFPPLQKALENTANHQFQLEGASIPAGSRAYSVTPIVVASPSEDKKYNYRASVTAKAIRARGDGHGLVDVYVDRDDNQAPLPPATFLNVQGASIRNVWRAGVTVALNEPKGVPVSNDSIFTFELFNLVDRATVTFGGENIEKATITVIATPIED